MALEGLGRRFGIAAGVLAAAAASAYAQRAVPTPTGCRAELTAADLADGGKVRAISDGRSFVLDDERDIRLAGLEVPLPPGSGEIGERAGAARAAAQASRAALESILLGPDLAGQIVKLRPSGAAEDRYGRMLAHVYVVRGGTVQSVAHEMLGRGFARFSAQIGNPAGKNAGDRPGDRLCAAELLGRERAAREAKLGLWGEPYYGIVGAENGAELVAERGYFTVVEGKVVSVRESGGTIYVNFGRRWSEALTVTILKRNERSFAAAGLEPRRLENRRVRVRGWIEERNGPRIEAARPEQIEIAERN